MNVFGQAVQVDIYFEKEQKEKREKFKYLLVDNLIIYWISNQSIRLAATYNKNSREKYVRKWRSHKLASIL